jgi:hypothetical protein
MGYIERIGEGRARRVVEGLRARGLGEVREAGPEVLEQLFIRLLRVGPAPAVSIGTVQRSAVMRATRTTQRAVLTTTATMGGAYRFRNIAGKLDAKGQSIQGHREGVRR